MNSKYFLISILIFVFFADNSTGSVISLIAQGARSVLGPKVITYLANVGMTAFAINGIRKDVIQETSPSSGSSSENQYKIIFAKEASPDTIQNNTELFKTTKATEKTTVSTGTTRSYQTSTRLPDMVTRRTSQHSAKPTRSSSRTPKKTMPPTQRHIPNTSKSIHVTSTTKTMRVTTPRNSIQTKMNRTRKHTSDITTKPSVIMRIARARHER